MTAGLAAAGFLTTAFLAGVAFLALGAAAYRKEEEGAGGLRHNEMRLPDAA